MFLLFSGGGEVYHIAKQKRVASIDQVVAKLPVYGRIDFSQCLSGSVFWKSTNYTAKDQGYFKQS